MQTLREVLFDNPAVAPEREALVWNDRRLSYAELHARVRRAGNALIAGGVGPGDRVAVLLENHHAFVELFYAITGIGAVIVPLNYRLIPSEHAAILSDAGPVTMISTPAYAENVAAIRAALPGLRRVVMVESGDSGAGDIDYEDWLAASHEAPFDGPLSPGDTASLLYTSGTTSLPKGVMLSHANYIADYLNTAGLYGTGPHSRNLQISPLYHAAAQHAYLQTWGGGCNVLLPKFDPGHILALIERERINHLFVVPTMLYNVMDHPDIETTDLSTLKVISYGAAPITGARLEEALKRFGPILYHAYGLTECCSHGTALEAEAHLQHAGSIGRGLPGSEIIVVDEAGERVPASESGEIWVRGAQVMKGYWNRPEVTAETLAGGWLHTGDIGTWDAEGYVRVIDRKKDMIISGGVNIFPTDVEEVLARHPAVAEVAVYGVPHDNWGEAVEAAVVLRRGAAAGAEELIAHARQNLAHFKAPRSIRFMEALPRNPSGKILKRELRRMAAETAAA